MRLAVSNPLFFFPPFPFVLFLPPREKAILLRKLSGLFSSLFFSLPPSPFFFPQEKVVRNYSRMFKLSGPSSFLFFSLFPLEIEMVAEDSSTISPPPSSLSPFFPFSLSF